MPGNSYVNVNTKKLTPGKLDFEDLKIPGFPLLNFEEINNFGNKI